MQVAHALAHRERTDPPLAVHPLDEREARLELGAHARERLQLGTYRLTYLLYRDAPVDRHMVPLPVSLAAPATSCLFQRDAVRKTRTNCTGTRRGEGHAISAHLFSQRVCYRPERPTAHQLQDRPTMF